MNADKRKEKSIIPVIAALILVIAFAITLFAALASIGAVDGEISTTQNSPERLVSAGAPRSQIALKQMFDSMGAVRTNGNRVVYEPITEEYLSNVTDKIENGEKPRLSVEEILYIISDSVACAEKYDGVTLHGVGTVSFKKDHASRPSHLFVLEKRKAVYSIIVYRIKSLCHDGAFEADEKSLIYYPDEMTEGSRAKRFVFTEVTDSERAENIVFYPGDGQRIALYPSADAESVDLKYMLQNDEPLSVAERDILENSGYDADRCRNVTPSYWGGYTDCKLVIIGGRIVIVDPISGKAIDSAPNGMKTVSLAAGDSDGDKKYELYFTAYSEFESAAIRYLPGESEAEILFSESFCIGVYENLDDDGVSFYRAEQTESRRYLNLMRRIGKSISDDKWRA